MAKEFKKWIDEFVENGADPADITKWPSEAGGGEGPAGGASFQIINNNRQILTDKRYRVDWSKFPDYVQKNYGINPDLTLAEIGGVGQYESQCIISIPLVIGDGYSNSNPNSLIFTDLLSLRMSFATTETGIGRSGYLGGLLDFTIYVPNSKTLREAISLLPTETAVTSTGPYAMLVLGGITLTEITE